MQTEYYVYIFAAMFLLSFVINYVIHLRFALIHKKINEELESYPQEKFLDVKTRMVTKAIFGFSYRWFRSDVIFIQKNIFVLLSNKPLPFIKMNQYVIRLTGEEGKRSFQGVSKTYQINTIIHQSKEVTIEFTDKQIIDIFMKMRLNLKDKDINIDDLLHEMGL